MRGSAVKRVILIAGVLLGPGLAAGGARADRITYTFTGTDRQTGAAVTGSFAYQTDAPASHVSTEETLFGDVRGSLTITLAGHTDTSGSVSGLLRPGSLLLISGDRTGRGFAITLKPADPGSVTVFPDRSSLPATLNPAALTGSGFSIYQGPPLDVPPGQAVPLAAGNPAAIALLADGPITLDSVTIASVPEPGGLALAALGAAVAGGALSRRRPCPA